MVNAIAEIAELCQHVSLGLCGWDAPLEKLASLTGSSRAQLIGLGGPAVTPFNWITGGNLPEFDRLTEIDGYSPHVNFRVAQSTRSADMEIVDERHYAAVRRMLANDLYLDFCEQTEIPLGCQTKLHSDDSRLIGLALLRSRPDGATSHEERMLFGEASRHIRATIRLQLHLEQKGRSLLLGAMDALSARAVLLDGYGRICGIADPAQRFLTGSNRLVVRDGRIGTARAAEGDRIDRALAAILGPNPPPEGVDVFLPPRTEEESGLILTFRSLPAVDWNLGAAPRGLLTIGAAIQTGKPGMERLRSLFDLTESEASVALAMAEGRSRAAIAIARGVSIGTIRSQIKAIFRKVGVSREAELISIVLGAQS